MKKTAEHVTPKHPDKLSDFIADSILDEYRKNDQNTRGAIEVMGGHNVISIIGEVTSASILDDQNIKQLVSSIVGDSYTIYTQIDKQSPEIARGVDTGGAGDQGIVRGYATNETDTLLPLEYELARNLAQEIYKRYPYDGKTQVTLGKNNEVEVVVASFQNAPQKELLELVRNIIESKEYFINQAGDWNIGGFDADTGLTGRKIVVDNYGPQIAVGGGAFSGKDFTKVDRSGAYMARKISVDLLTKHSAKEVSVQIAYAIGKPHPVEATAILDGRILDISTLYNLEPSSMRDALKLDELNFKDTSVWGHFGRGFEWDKPFDN